MGCGQMDLVPNACGDIIRIIRLVFAGLARRMVAQLQMKEIVTNVGMIGMIQRKPVRLHRPLELKKHPLY